MSSEQLRARVVRAAEAALAQQNYVAPVDVLVRMGWLAPSHVDEWRHGRIESLETGVQANLTKVSRAMHLFRQWAHEKGLKPSETAYVARTRDRRRLQFSKTGDPRIEAAYRTHWVSPALSEAKKLTPERAPVAPARPRRHRRPERLGLHRMLGQRRPAAHGRRRAHLHGLRRPRPPRLST